MQDRFPRVRKIPIRFEIFPPPDESCEISPEIPIPLWRANYFPEKLISISRKVGSSTILPAGDIR